MYYAFKQPEVKGRRGAVVAIKGFVTRSEALSYARRRCRLTGDVYQIANESAIVTMGPQVIEITS